MTDEKKMPDWWVFKCKCHTWITDYPFTSCSVCKMTYCGSEEDLKKAKEDGMLIECLKDGMGEPNIMELEKELGVSIENGMMDNDYDYGDDNDEYPEDEDNPSCVEGFSADECCQCVGRSGIECCDFNCPFGGADNRCDDETRKKCEDEYYKEQEDSTGAMKKERRQ
jgi:hypothetical protein